MKIKTFVKTEQASMTVNVDAHLLALLDALQKEHGYPSRGALVNEILSQALRGHKNGKHQI